MSEPRWKSRSDSDLRRDVEALMGAARWSREDRDLESALTLERVARAKEAELGRRRSLDSPSPPVLGLAVYDQKEQQ